MKENRITLQQAQELWESMRLQIKLAPFKDDGVPLPEIDMSKFFRGRKTAPVEEIEERIRTTIEKWNP